MIIMLGAESRVAATNENKPVFTSIDFGKIKTGKTIEITRGVNYDVEAYELMFGHPTQPRRQMNKPSSSYPPLAVAI